MIPRELRHNFVECDGITTSSARQLGNLTRGLPLHLRLTPVVRRPAIAQRSELQTVLRVAWAVLPPVVAEMFSDDVGRGWRRVSVHQCTQHGRRIIVIRLPGRVFSG